MASGFKVAFDGRTIDLSDLYMEKVNLATYEFYLWTFGNGDYGKLGNNSTAPASSPIQTVAGGINWASISCGVFHTAAVKTDGTLWTWGNRLYGKLGINTTAIDKSSPDQTISGGTNWSNVACGYGNTNAIKTDGTLWTWGYNAYGQLGDNTIINKSSPIQTISLGTNWLSVSGGRGHIAALKTDGTLWTWGYNNFGQLGDNTTTNKSSPVQTIAYGTDWASVTCGEYHTAAVKTDGTLWLWGLNSNGQIGDNTLTNRSSPVQTASGGTIWASVAGGSGHTVATKTDGTLWTWGLNSSGELGINNVSRRFAPVQTISGGTDWSKIACGLSYTMAIKTDGTLWLWGNNNWGQLGINNRSNRSSPVQIISGGTNWTKIAGGSLHSAAITIDTILP